MKTRLLRRIFHGEHMSKKSIEKTELIEAISKIPIDPTEKADLCAVINHNNLSQHHLSLLFTLLDFKSALHNVSSDIDVTAHWQSAIQFYKEHGLDQPLTFSKSEKHYLIECLKQNKLYLGQIIEGLIKKNQLATETETQKTPRKL